MANWQRVLRLQPEWGMAQEEEITRAELALVIAKRGDQSMDGKWNGKKVCWVDTITGATC